MTTLAAHLELALVGGVGRVAVHAPDGVPARHLQRVAGLARQRHLDEATADLEDGALRRHIRVHALHACGGGSCMVVAHPMSTVGNC